MNTEDVLAQIDGALEDWEVGPDAMRCNAPAGLDPGVRRGNLYFVDESHRMDVDWLVALRLAGTVRPLDRFTIIGTNAS